MASTKPRKDWKEIHRDYTGGMPVRRIGEKYNIDHAQVVRKAKKEGWLNNDALAKTEDELSIVLAKMVNEHIDEYPEAKELQKKVHNNLLPTQIEQANKDIATMALYKANLMRLQEKFTKVVEKSAIQVERILDECEDGLYTSSSKADGSATYERTTKFLADLVPFFAENNKALGMATAQVAIQNNVNTGNSNNEDDTIVKFYIPENGR